MEAWKMQRDSALGHYEWVHKVKRAAEEFRPLFQGVSNHLPALTYWEVMRHLRNDRRRIARKYKLYEREVVPDAQQILPLDDWLSDETRVIKNLKQFGNRI